MPPPERFLDLQSHVAELLAQAQLPPPDRTEHEQESVVLFWDGPRVAVRIDLDPGNAA